MDTRFLHSVALYFCFKFIWSFTTEVLCSFFSSCWRCLFKSVVYTFLRILLILKNFNNNSFSVAQIVEHGASNAKIMGSIPRESKSR